MTNQSTIDKLIEMRLTAMADAFRNQLDDPKCREIPFEDQLRFPQARTDGFPSAGFAVLPHRNIHTRKSSGKTFVIIFSVLLIPSWKSIYPETKHHH